MESMGGETEVEREVREGCMEGEKAATVQLTLKRSNRSRSLRRRWPIWRVDRGNAAGSDATERGADAVEGAD